MCLGTFSRLARSLATIFLCNGEFLGISRYIKKTRHVSIPGLLVFCRFYLIVSR